MVLINHLAMVFIGEKKKLTIAHALKSHIDLEEVLYLGTLSCSDIWRGIIE